MPRPQGPGSGTRWGSSLLARAQHDLGDKVDDGRSRLVGVQLGEEVAGVVRGAPLFPGHEAKEPGGAGDKEKLNEQTCPRALNVESGYSGESPFSL